jgi:hypothetical protein
MRKNTGQKKQKCKNCEGKGTLKKGDKMWAAEVSGDEKMRQIGQQHAASVIPLHQRKDNSFIQSSTLDASGRLVRHHTHKGYSDTSTWGRAQVWGTLFSTMGYLRARKETSWLDADGGGIRVPC